MLKLIQSSCSVVLLSDSRCFSYINFYSLIDHFEPLISQRRVANSQKLLTTTTNSFYETIVDDLMRKKSKSKKSKRRAVDNVAKKTKSSSRPLYKRLIPTMSCKDASCSSMTQNFEKSLTTDDSTSSNDVVILDSPDSDNIQVLYDSHHPRNDLAQYYLKSDKESPQTTLSAEESEKAAKKGKEKLQEIRTEKFTKFGEEITRSGEPPKHRKDGFVFRVLSWNILSQKLMEQHKYLYLNSNNVSLDWEYRKKLLLSEIKDSNADIITLQEVEERGFHNLAELKDLGYEGIFKKRTHDKVDGCAMYYRPDALVLKEHSFVEFYQPGVRLLDRDNVGVVARFEPKSFKGTEFIVATTHLLYNPRRHDIKLVQMQLLLAEIERISFSGAIRQNDKIIPMYYPCILTGDLNLSPESGVYNLITEGELQYEHLSSRNLASSESPNSYQNLPRELLPPYLGITNNCQHDLVVSHRRLVRLSSEEERRQIQLYNSERRSEPYLKTDTPSNSDQNWRNSSRTAMENKYGSGVLSHNLKFKSVYTHEKDGKPEATTHHNWWITVDYIFYSPVSKNQKESNLRLVSYKKLPTADEAQHYIETLPNLFCGSDHLPLVSTFFLAKS